MRTQKTTKIKSQYYLPEVNFFIQPNNVADISVIYDKDRRLT